MRSVALDLRNESAVMEMIRDWKPAAIVHTAYRRGDRTSTVDATAHVARAAAAVGARLVHMSTDAIFKGQLAPYTELDPPNPVHDYGRQKAEAEAIVTATTPSAVIVRTSLILGVSELSGHEMLVRDVVSGRSRTAFFRDEIRSPVLVDDLARAVVELADRRDVTGVLNLGGPEPLSRAMLAVMTARRHGWDESKLTFANISDSGMRRPTKVVLDSSLAARHGITVRGPDTWM